MSDTICCSHILPLQYYPVYIWLVKLNKINIEKKCYSFRKCHSFSISIIRSLSAKILLKCYLDNICHEQTADEHSVKKLTPLNLTQESVCLLHPVRALTFHDMLVTWPFRCLSLKMQNWQIQFKQHTDQ